MALHGALHAWVSALSVHGLLQSENTAPPQLQKSLQGGSRTPPPE
eukprot:CAMPEP_0204154108 /NCGR_PEP_ID=MMETSP0361-20130328/28435_1 /ASSEMBLY_ACC=CAM_ASM_000343 /TAXON_ID=268821 /ORGANISM="Scrippsiella Hangoei, Strain SHTV-5" /LENGTH=44 /DNA_ID= /DNA_START= /DNA_END= /DNA_ORIENTATION=